MSQIDPRTQAIIDTWVQAIKANGGEPFDRGLVEQAFMTSLAGLKCPTRPIRWIENLETAFLYIANKGAAWNAAWDAARNVAWEDVNPFASLREVARYVEIYWVMQDEIVFVPKAKMQYDERHRLHCLTGKAVTYPDGHGYWFYKGVKVTEQIIEQPDTLDAKQIINEPNAEVRRVMIERLGLDLFLTHAKAQPIHTDDHRALYKIPMKNDEPIVAVKVRCPSTGQIYFLRVPPQIDRCDKAVAWSFGFNNVRDYHPAIET